MKKIIIGVLVALTYSYHIIADSKTTFITRLISTDQIFELAQSNYNFHKNYQKIKSIFDIKPFYQTSVQDKKNTPYFLFNNKCCLNINEDGSGDIDSLWFNVISNTGSLYSSSISLKPQRRTMGFVFTYYQYLPWMSEDLWFGINSALVYARHTLNLTQGCTPNAGTLPCYKDSIQALTSCAQTAGKFYCNAISNIGLDDLQLKLGYDLVHADESWAALYLIGTIPTGGAIESRYIFEPAVGSNHGSIGAGFNGEIELYSCDSNDALLTVMFDTNYRYVFGAQERRSFDLKNGDWSRYLLVATESQPLYSMPGINFFTRNVQIIPASTFQLWTALHYSLCEWHFELGYNFWFRAREKIKCFPCNCNLPCNVGIYSLVGMCEPPATSASSATISQGFNQVNQDAVFTPVTTNDFNLCSALNEQVLTNKIYGSFLFKKQFESCDIDSGFNASYEFSRSCSALNQVACWLNMAISFK